MTNTFGSGVSCQGASLNVTPFVFSSGNYPWDPGAYGSHTMNPGISATLTMPLDGESQQLCKERAKATINRENAETAKAKLDFELVRLLRCGEAKQKGFFFHPQSPYAAVCADVVVKGTTELPVSLRSSGE